MPASGPLKVLVGEKLLELRIFVDRSVVEAFGLGEREVAVVGMRPNAMATGVSVFSGGNTTMVNLTI